MLLCLQKFVFLREKTVIGSLRKDIASANSCTICRKFVEIKILLSQADCCFAPAADVAAWHFGSGGLFLLWRIGMAHFEAEVHLVHERILARCEKFNDGLLKSDGQLFAQCICDLV